MSVLHKPRLYHLEQGSNGYGFHLHGEKGKVGQKIRKVEPGSPAEVAGLRVGDCVVAVNGWNVENESHQEIVARIKERAGETDLLVVDEEANQYFKQNSIDITEGLIGNEDTVQQEQIIKKVDGPRPRLCKLTRSDQGFGFNLHSEKGKQGRFIRSVDEGGAADRAGLLAGDRIIEINGVNMEYERHASLVAAIKESGTDVELLVVDDQTDRFFKLCDVTPSSVHVEGALPQPPTPVVTSQSTPPPTTPLAPQPNGDSPADILNMDLTTLKSKARSSKKKAAPSSNWNNRQSIFNNL
uniref:Na(+)/H(+) exchange regulatory cofactor NHE-RF1 n=1 Tax=Ciona intestinalis TaxID=7719 RepID=F6ZRL9_CIOIN|nr:Na(+)/H(+) exchange regulatory cofactor NHE-RF1 [Ciona intestinalis]|eukprot:XP_002129232.1 Na(+)/H(+) exchange regulatory cofactor NHE-RF1 [Ciona intestinalis]